MASNWVVSKGDKMALKLVEKKVEWLAGRTVAMVDYWADCLVASWDFSKVDLLDSSSAETSVGRTAGEKVDWTVDSRVEN